jgi:hypothetical protein
LGNADGDQSIPAPAETCSRGNQDNPKAQTSIEVDGGNLKGLFVSPPAGQLSRDGFAEWMTFPMDVIEPSPVRVFWWSQVAWLFLVWLVVMTINGWGGEQ